MKWTLKMESILKYIPDDLPAWAYIGIVLLIVITVIIITKLTGNSNKQSVGSKNTFSGNTNINQQIGRDITNHKDKEES